MAFKRETLLGQILENAMEGVFIARSSGKSILYANKAAERLLGYKTDGLTGLCLAEIGILDNVEGKNGETDADREAQIATASVLNAASGTLVPVTLYERYVEEGGDRYRIVYFRPITEVDEAKAEADAAFGLLDKIFDATPFPMSIVRASDNRMLRVNRASVEFFGLTEAEILAKYSTDFYVDLCDREKYLAALDANNRADGVEIRLWNFSGRGERICLLSSFPLIYYSEAAHLAAMMDITEIREAQSAAEDARIEAVVANRAKSRFLSSMNHELRTPLNAILGFAQLMSMDPREPLSEKQRERLKYINQSGEHLLSLIGDVLDLAKVDSGNVDIDIEDVAVGDLIEEGLISIRPMAIISGIKIVNEAKGQALPPVRGNRLKARQVLLNLLSNAVKYNNAKGEVRVLAETPREGWLRVAIADTGPGIAPDQQANVFLPFNRLGRENSGIEGSGIGLTLAKQLMHKMDGRIGLNSRPGKGSEFWIELPLASAGAVPQRKSMANSS